MEALDETFEAIPPELEPPEDPDEELEASDESEVPFLAAEAPTPAPLGRTPAYDFVERGFVSAASGPLMLYGRDALAQWIAKCLITPRGGAPAVDPDFGLDSIDLLLDGSPFDASAAAELEEMVEEALTVHPRIKRIEDWEVAYEPGDDAVFISFRVLAEGDDQVEAQELAVDDFPLLIGAARG